MPGKISGAATACAQPVNVLEAGTAFGEEGHVEMAAGLQQRPAYLQGCKQGLSKEAFSEAQAAKTFYLHQGKTVAEIG